jgi:phospholipase/carboxylesterase
MVGRLIEVCMSLPHVRAQESRMAVPETRALCLPDRFSHGPGEAFIDDHEFCHLHAAPPGGVHLTLPEPLRRAAVASGWAEQHPAVSGGILPATVVMVYAPRDAQELGVVLRLVEASRLFAEGVLPNVRESA